MGTTDSGNLPQSFDRVVTSCEEIMVQLMECQNMQNPSLNGIHQISNSAINYQDIVSQTLPANESSVKENTHTNKRKFVESDSELINKKVNNDGLNVVNFENTGRGKRIKKLKKSFFDELNDESEQLNLNLSRRSDRRFAKDSDDDEYVPYAKMSKSENGSSASSSNLSSVQRFTSNTISSILQRPAVKPFVKKVSEINSANCEDNEEVIEIAVSEEGDGESNNPLNNLVQNVDKNSQDSIPEDDKYCNKSYFTDISIAIETYNSPDITRMSTPKPSSISPVSEMLENQPDSQSTLLHHINTLVKSKSLNNQVKPVTPSLHNQTKLMTSPQYNQVRPIVAQLQDPVKVVTAMPVDIQADQVMSVKLSPKKVIKKPRKPLKKANRTNFMLDETDRKQIDKLKSLVIKKQDKNSDSSKQAVGPFVRCKGPKDSLNLCKVVNVKDSQDTENNSSNPAKYTMIPRETCCSNASSRMNENVPWKCILCSAGSSYNNLGDLFGPYFPSQSNVAITKQNADSKAAKADKSLIPPNVLPSEIWVHCDCAVWTNGIFVSGGRLRGLEEAAVVAQQSICSSCNQKGATLGCLVKGCEMKYHYLCACHSDCTLRMENFSILCPKHKNYRISRPPTISEPANGQMNLGNIR